MVSFNIITCCGLINNVPCNLKRFRMADSGYRLHVRGVAFSIPGRAKSFSSPPKRRGQVLAHPASCQMGRGGSLPRAKSAGAWSYTSTPLYVLTACTGQFLLYLIPLMLSLAHLRYSDSSNSVPLVLCTSLISPH